MKTTYLGAAVGAAAALAAGPALAHADPAMHGSFAAGFTHPISGLDHILAMVAVGLWATMLGRRATVGVPSAFVAVMAAGFGLAMLGMGLPFVEPMILASVVVLGLMVAASVRLPAGAGAALVGVFAMFHGHAHGAEIGAASAGQYLAGFVAGTVLLHALGVAAGLGIARALEARGGAAAMATRGLGAGVAALGVGLSFGVV